MCSGQSFTACSSSKMTTYPIPAFNLSVIFIFFAVFFPYQTAAYQAPPSMGFSRQEYWSGLPLPSAHASKVMFKILQARLQRYVNRELPDVQAGFRKGRGARDQIANIRWIIKKAREFQESIYFCFIDYAKAFDCVDHNKLENSERARNTRPPDLPPEKSVCRSRSNS